jgi:probable F420-dependent oxidoreductase
MSPPDEVVQAVPGGAVVVGMQLPIQSQSTLYVAEWETTAGPVELAAVARAAEQAGFFYLGVCDHTAIPRRLAEAMGTTWYDTVATLGWLAGITNRVRLLSHVLVLAARHPLRAAKELATLDRLSGGRLIVGVGAGHVPEEYAMLAGEGSFERRGRDTDEAIAALAVALRDEFPVLPGPRWPVADMAVAPRPVQDPRPPIWIGGSSIAAIRRTALFGDGWLPQGTPRPQLPAQIEQLRRYRDELRGGAPIDIGTIAEPIYLRGPGMPGDRTWHQPHWSLNGGPDEVAASLRELVEMGVDHLQARFMARSLGELCDQMAAFGDHVIPLLTS